MEQKQVCKGIRTAFNWVFDNEEWPCLAEVREAIAYFNPILAMKIVDIVDVRLLLQEYINL